MQEGMRLRLELDGCPELTREGLQDALEGEEVGRPLGRPPARRARVGPRPGPRRSAARRRAGGARPRTRHPGRRPPAISPGQGRCAPTRTGRRARRRERGCSGRRRGASRAAWSGARNAPSESGIGDPDRRPPKVALGQPQPPRKAGVGEAQGDHGVEAQIPHHVLGAAAQRLLAGESARPGRAACGRVAGRCSS